jgi:hypothetical protein
LIQKFAGVVITDAIKFVQTNKEKLTRSVKEEQNGKESKDIDNGEDDNEEDGDQLEENQEEEIGEEEPKEETTNQVF